MIGGTPKGFSKLRAVGHEQEKAKATAKPFFE